MFVITIALEMLSLTALSYSGLPRLGLNLSLDINLPGKNVEKPTYTNIVDWRKAGAVTDVKNQGQYNFGWAFAATGALEGQHFRKTGELVSLSEQNLIDCDTQSGGGNESRINAAFQYIQDNGGIDTEQSYPYQGKQGQCRYDPSNVGANCTGYKDIACGDGEALQEAVERIGPMTVTLNVNKDSFAHYQGGVYDDPSCPVAINHGALVVGYGQDHSEGKDYWLVKNSYGKDWGEKGYIRMARNKNNMCGIGSMASYPTV